MGNNEVTVVVRIKAKAGSEDRVRQELRNILAPTRVEKGCINFDMHQSPDDESLFLFHENWESEDDLNRHLEAPHIRRWLGLADELLAEPMELTLWRKVG